MTVPQTDDLALIQRMAQRDESALAALYDRYGRLIYSVAYAVVQERETAEEVTLDIFARAWEHAARYDPQQAALTTWLTHMARNRAIDRLRREQVRPLRHSVRWADGHAGHLPAGDDGVRPEATVHLRWQQQRVRAAVAELPHDQQQALALAYFHGLSHSEIAAALGTPLGTVKSRIRAALGKLRHVLGDG